MKRFLVLLFCLALSAVGFAQTTSTEILGTVTDPSGAVVAGAKVRLRNQATGITRDTTTSSAGDYAFPLIDVGMYTVIVEMSGFTTAERTGIQVEVQQVARVDVQLVVGSTVSTVQVTGQAPLLKTDSSEVGEVVTREQILDLPLNGRSFSSLALLQPGVFYGDRAGYGGQSSSAGVIAGRGTALMANGQAEARQQVSIDGVVVTESLESTVFFTPSPEDIEEFTIETSGAPAEYGESSGAYAQLVLKTGTNKFHGDLFEFLRNDKLDAADYFLNFQAPPGSIRLPKNVLKRNQFGAVLGGPVIIPHLYDGSNRTFWSFDYEGVRQVQDTPTLTNTFPQAFHNGDFSSLLTPPISSSTGKPIRAPIVIYNPINGLPFTSSGNGSGTITNVIPQNMVIPAAKSFLDTYMPLPNLNVTDPLANNLELEIPNVLTSNQYLVRVDHELKPNDRLMMHLIFDRDSDFVGTAAPAFPNTVTTHPDNYSAQYVHAFSPSIMNEFRYGYNKADWFYLTPRTNSSFNPNSLGLGTWQIISEEGTRPFTSTETGIPGFTLTSGCCGDGQGGQFLDATTHQFSDNLLISRGSHNMKMGGEFRREIVIINFANVTRGTVSYGLGGNTGVGFLLGDPSATLSAGGLPFTKPVQNRFGLYYQDNWRARKNLTINMGVRYDYFGAASDDDGNWRNLSLDKLSQGPDGKLYPTMIPTPGTKNYQFNMVDNRPYIQPRAGLAYKVKDKWVVRAAGGWYVNPHYLNNYEIGAREPPLNATYNYTDAYTPFETIPYTYGGVTYNAQTNIITSPASSTLSYSNLFPGGGTPASTVATITDPWKDRFTNVWEWNLDVQRELPSQTTLVVAYVGNHSNHVDDSVNNFDAANPCLQSVCTNYLHYLPYQWYVDPSTGSNALHGISSIRYLDFNGNGHYEGLQVSLQKRYTHGLVAGLAYTYGLGLSDSYDRNTTAWSYQRNLANRTGEMQPMYTDLRHLLVLNYDYTLPYLSRFKGVAGAFLSGWQTNGIINLHTGFPLTLAGGNLNGGSTGISRPDQIANPKLPNPTRQLWFNPAAFSRTDCTIAANPGLCHYGDAGPGILRGPGLHDFDLSLFKNWQLGKSESTKLQFRAEFFNAFNTPQFGQPNGLAWVSSNSVTPDGPTVGTITTDIVPNRQIQFAMKLLF